MHTLKIISIFILGGVLAACGSSGSSSGSSGSSGGVVPPPVDEDGSQIEIVNTPLPIIEDFTAVDAVGFFSPAYKALATPSVHTIQDEDGNDYTLEDPNPSFYYPTCCFWETDPDTGERTGNLIEDLDDRLRVSDGKMLVGNARFSIGQILSDLTNEDAVDRKSDTSDGALGVDLESGSWGELDLSSPYRVSFCLNDVGLMPPGQSNLEVWVDNNSGGRQIESIHGAASMLLRTPTNSLPKGNRLIVEIPGDTYIEGEENNPLAVNADLVGTATSYLQLRVSSGGYAVISDLVIESQDENNAAGLECIEDDDFFTPPAPEGIPFSGLPLNVDLNMTFDEFFGAEGTAFVALSGNPTMPFYKPIAGASRMWVEDNAITWGDGRFGIGHIEGTQGDIDLSAPYRVSFEVVKAHTGGTFQIWVNNFASGVGGALHGEDSLIYVTDIGDLTPGEVVVIETSVGNANSFFQFRCDSGCGQPASGADTLGLTIKDIVIEYQGAGPGNGDPVGSDRAWESFEESLYEDILENPLGGGNNPLVPAAAPHEVDGLLFFRAVDSGATVRHRGGSNPEWNFNGATWDGGNSVEVPADGEDAPELRGFIGIPVESGRALTIAVEHRNSSGSAEAGRIVFIGSDNTVLGSEDATSNESATTDVALPDGHGQSHVKVIYSREGAGGGGMHVSQIHRTYND